MSTKPRRILVIDDDADIGMMMKMMLEYEGYTVDVIEKADEAEEMLQQSNVDLIIMDMLLSGINGLDICKRLKQDSELAKIPVLMISAYPNAGELAADAGAEDFISKPFEMKEILSKIRQLVQPG